MVRNGTGNKDNKLAYDKYCRLVLLQFNICINDQTALAAPRI